MDIQKKNFLYAPKLPGHIKDAIVGATKVYSLTSTGHILPNKEVSYLMKRRNIFLSGKQVPSCLLLRAAGNFLTKKVADELLATGFPLEVSVNNGCDWESVTPSNVYDSAIRSATGVSSIHEVLSGMVKRAEEVVTDDPLLYGESENDFVANANEEDRSSDDGEDDASIETDTTLSEETFNKEYLVRISYTDPFEAVAAVELSTRMGHTPPKVLVWEGDILRLTDPIPYRILSRYGYESRGRRSCAFVDLSNPGVKRKVILNHTHWGHLIKSALSKIKQGKPDWSDQWHAKLWKMIKSFLQGDSNPLWNKSMKEMKGTQSKARLRSVRLLQVLQTIDGIFLQKWVSFPDEVWTWRRFDNFVLGMIWQMLPDEFLSGEIEAKALDLTTAYEVIQDIRKRFKYAYNMKALPELIESVKTERLLYRVFEDEWKFILEEKDSYYNLLIAGVLGQKRGSGTPPSLSALKSKIKFLNIVSSEAQPLTDGQKGEICRAMETTLRNLPDTAFTGLTTKAGVRVSTNACLEKTRENGGTAQAINQFVYEGNFGRPVYLIDLETGARTEEKLLSECSVGDYIFWRCLEEVLATPLDQLRDAVAIGVQEPGKTRVITKTSASLKVVLDVVHGITAWPLGKIPSSESGMTKDNHGWNFFREFFSHRDMNFDLKSVDTEGTPDNFVRTNTYKTVWVSSTDYSTATDYLHHEVAGIMATYWMRKCGIPKVLRGVVNAVCYKPRKIIFKATGCLKEIGTRYDDDSNFVMLRRGVLMGDPMTKVVLHMTNICTRHTGVSIASKIDRTHSSGKDWNTNLARPRNNSLNLKV